MIRRGKYKGWYEGSYKNFRVRYNSNYGIYLMGSISNYYKGYAFLLKHKNLRLAIDKLGNELGLYLHSGKIIPCRFSFKYSYRQACFIRIIGDYLLIYLTLKD